jgi:hypothetical protein
MKFTVNSIKIFTSWSYNLSYNTECSICRNSLNGPSLYNQEKGEDSVIVDGVCGHSFHYECIKPWIEKHKYCPNCSVTWNYKNPGLIKDLDDSKKKPKKQPPV